MAKRSHRQRRGIQLLEALEKRQLLAAGDPFINEFLASNGTGLVDDNGAHSDWIEIYNPGAAAVNLTNWHLTDNKALPNEWTFPAGTSIAAGGYLVVFADGSISPVGPGGKLHANFSLNSEGEYLAITRPDNSVVNAFDPYPKQTTDISYGTGPATTQAVTVVSPGAAGTPGNAAKVFIPGDNSLGSTWTGSGFDDSTWISGNVGVGFEVPANVSQFRTHMVDTSVGTINNINQATALLDGNLGGYTVAFDGTANSSTVNYGDPGSFTGTGNTDQALPNGLVGTSSNGQPGREQYALRTTANITIPVGTWTFDVNSDAGFRLTIPGVTFTNVVNQDVAGAANTLQFTGLRTSGHTLGTVTVSGTSALSTTLQLDYFDANGADLLELSVASSSRASFSGTNTFSLLKDGVTPSGQGGTPKSFAISAPAAPQYAGLIGNNVPQMQNNNASAYVRVPFSVADLTNLSGMTLKVKYDDGYVAYLNGVEIARKNAGGTAGTPLAFNAAAASDRANSSALVFENVDVSAFKNLLVAGDNVLAFQALNSSAANNDLLLVPQLDLTYTVPAGLEYMKPATPGAANTGSTLGVAADTNFSVGRGYYDDPFDVQITTQQKNAVIYYTLDGRSPLNADGSLSTSAVKYTGPIHVGTTTTLRAVTTAAGWTPSNVDTETYLFANDIIHQPDVVSQPGFPSQWINLSNQVVSYPLNGQAKYGMTQTVVTKYQSEIVNDLKSIPAISVVMNPDDLFGNGSTGTNGIKGIYTNSPQGDDANSTWERAMSAEMIFPDGTNGFEINGGIQIQGGGSRTPSNTPKHSFRLVFKTKYGASSLDYPVFSDTGVDSFDALILKAQYNNTWTHWDSAQRTRAQYVNDQWASDVEGAMGDPTKHGRYVQLYLNGVYWGMYSLTERPSSSWAAANLGGNKDDYDVFDNNAVLIDGNSTAFNTMFSLANQMITLANGGQSTDSVYQQLQQYVDVPSFIDFMVLNQYGGNQDWDDHNWYAVRHSRENGVATNQYGGFRFVAFDSERILEGETQNITGLNNDLRPTRLFQALKRNAEFRMQFADRVHQLLFNGGPLTAANAKALFIAETQKVYPALASEEARWGTYRKDYQGDASTYYSRDGQWQTEFNRLTQFDAGYAGANTGYFSVRGNELLKQYRAADANALTLYPSVDAAEWNQFGGNVSGGFVLTVSNLGTLPAGSVVYYTLDGSDPRLVGGGIAPGALVYPGNPTGITINASTRVFMRVYVPGTQTWSASTVASFFVGAAPRLRVTEIMYNPKAPMTPTFLKDDYEFIELQNTGASPLDPSGIAFTDGISFTFPAGSAAIAAGGRIVLVRNPAAFQERYGTIIPIAGTYTGELSDSGERITLTTGIGQEVESFAYNDGWFGQTDGDGFSLVANDPDASDASLSTKEGWRSGEPINGNPGAADPGLLNNSIIINELMPTASSGSNWIELKNTTDGAIDISGWYLSDDNTNRQKYTIAAGTSVSAHGFLTLQQNGGFGTGFALSALGGSVYLTSTDNGGIGGYRDAVDYGASDPDVSFGKYVKSTGGSDFTAMSAATPGGENGYPLVGPVVINEIMYNPFGLDREYVELRNVTDSAVSLAGWQFSDGINFTFGAGASIAADGYALVVPIDPSVFRSTYNIPASVPIFGPYTGALDNGGEKLTLAKPGAAVGPVTPFITVDRVNYDNQTPWPSPPDGTGPSLGRINAVKYGNDPINWRPDAVDGTAGVANSNPPLVFVSGFAYGSGPKISIKFSKDVGASLVNSDLVVTNVGSAQVVDSGQVSFSYDAGTQTGTWQLPGGLADGNYRAVLSAAAVSDAQGRPLDGNGDGTGGDDFSLDFFHLGGDANHDRSVNFSDLVTVAQNYGGSGKSFAQGDFNFDGSVDFADLVILAQRYNVTLGGPGSAAVVSGAPVEAAALAAAMELSTTGAASSAVIGKDGSPSPRPSPARGDANYAKEAVGRVREREKKPVVVKVPKPAVGAIVPRRVDLFAKKKVVERVFD